MFGWEYPPLHLGGLGVACQGLVQGLIKNGVQITLVLPHPVPTESEDLAILSPTEKHVERIRVQSMLSPYEGSEGYAMRTVRMSKELQQIYGADLPEAVAHFTAMSVDMTQDTNPDIVHCHDWMTYGAGMAAARYHDKPLVTHIHATELDRTHFHPNEWIYRMERKGFQAADRIIAVSNYTKNLLTEHYGIPAQKISVVHNAIQPITAQDREPPIQAISSAPKPPMVLFLGRLTIQKGPIQFLEMAAAVHRFRPDVTFVIAGEGNMMAEVINRACAMGLQDCILFTGKVANREADKLYSQAACFVMPSLSEPFGLVALEAMAHGTPVIISKQSGASEVVRHGFAIDFWDTEKMADCVLTILREQPLAQQLRSEAPRSLQHLTWMKQASQVRSIYQSLLS